MKIKQVRFSLGIIVVGLFMISGILFAQTSEKIVSGYGGAVWGATSSDIKKLYGNLVEATEALTDEEERAIGIRALRQSNPENLMTRRTFYFYDDKLYNVGVSYDDLDSNTIVHSLLVKFIEKYGKFDYSQDGKLTVGDGYYYVSYTDYYRYYSSDFEIRVRIGNRIQQSNDVILDLFVYFDYYNPIVTDLIEKKIIEQKSGDITL